MHYTHTHTQNILEKFPVKFIKYINPDKCLQSGAEMATNSSVLNNGPFCTFIDHDSLRRMNDHTKGPQLQMLHTLKLN